VVHAARWKCRTRKSPKIRHLRTIAQLCRTISSQLMHQSPIGKKLLNSNVFCTCPHNMVNFGPLATETCWRVWAPQQISTGFASWQRYARHSSSGRQPNIVVLNRGRHLYSGRRPSRWALAHFICTVHRYH